MPSLKYRSARTKPLAPLGFGSHKLDGIRRILYGFSNQVKVLHNVTPIDLLAQSAVLSDGVVVSYLYNLPQNRRGG